MTQKKNKTIPCVDIPIKFLRTPYVSDLQQIILDWFDRKEMTYKLCHLQGKYSIIFADHSDALQFKLVMGHWEDTLPEPDFLFTSAINTTFAGNTSGYVTIGGSGGSAGSITISGSNGYGVSGGGGGGYTYVSGGTGVSIGGAGGYYEYDTGLYISDTNGSK